MDLMGSLALWTYVICMCITFSTFSRRIFSFLSTFIILTLLILKFSKKNINKPRQTREKRRGEGEKERAAH